MKREDKQFDQVFQSKQQIFKPQSVSEEEVEKIEKVEKASVEEIITDDVHGYYRILGLTNGAGKEMVAKAYKKAALKMHPDKGGNSEHVSRYFLIFFVV